MYLDHFENIRRGSGNAENDVRELPIIHWTFRQENKFRQDQKS